jgi:hypothetical protein
VGAIGQDVSVQSRLQKVAVGSKSGLCGPRRPTTTLLLPPSIWRPTSYTVASESIQLESRRNNPEINTARFVGPFRRHWISLRTAFARRSTPMPKCARLGRMVSCLRPARDPPFSVSWPGTYRTALRRRTRKQPSLDAASARRKVARPSRAVARMPSAANALRKDRDSGQAWKNFPSRRTFWRVFLDGCVS